MRERRVGQVVIVLVRWKWWILEKIEVGEGNLCGVEICLSIVLFCELTDSLTLYEDH